jgi:uncharacterized protein YgbK (DUF1537 family)
MTNLLITYYADDLTGSTDALEVLSKAGARTLLFTGMPTDETLARYPDLEAFGIAGGTRSLGPDAIEKELTPVFEALLKLRPQHIHYKVCSTFDSSPTIGSIGRAIDVGRRVIGSPYVALLVAAPTLGRYCVFGHLFAAAGIGVDGQVYRLDRHPTASNHPATPMCESDLRLHLSEQTDCKVSSFDLLMLDRPASEQFQELGRLIEEGADVVLFDSLHPQHVEQVGTLIDHDQSQSQPQFSVGSSGINTALGRHWERTGKLTPRTLWDVPKQVNQVLVISGSCSPVTHSQIEWAKQSGFAEVAIDTPSLVERECSSEAIQKPTSLVMKELEAGNSVIAHTSSGNLDPRISATRKALESLESNTQVSGSTSSRLLGTALGRMVRNVLKQSALQRICICGGDTASAIGREIGIEALEMVSPLTVGAPLCEAHAPGSPAEGIEVVFKGGQVGKEDFFGSLLTGKNQNV